MSAEETRNKDGSTTVTLNPDSPIDRLNFGLRAFLEKPEFGAFIRELQVISPQGAPQITNGRYRHEVFLKVVVDSREPQSIEEIKDETERERFTQFLELYVKDASAAMERPQEEIQGYIRRIESQAESMNIDIAGKSLRSIILEIAVAISYQQISEKQNKSELP